MDKCSLDVLEKAFAAEIGGALGVGCGLLQTKSRIAEKLEKEGFLTKETIVVSGNPFPVSITGYRLTLLGNATYCFSCRTPPVNPGEDD